MTMDTDENTSLNSITITSIIGIACSSSTGFSSPSKQQGFPLASCKHWSSSPSPLFAAVRSWMGWWWDCHGPQRPFIGSNDATWKGPRKSSWKDSHSGSTLAKLSTFGFFIAGHWICCKCNKSWNNNLISVICLLCYPACSIGLQGTHVALSMNKWQLFTIGLPAQCPQTQLTFW